MIGKSTQKQGHTRNDYSEPIAVPKKGDGAGSKR
jgi:hypothetical protein